MDQERARDYIINCQVFDLTTYLGILCFDPYEVEPYILHQYYIAKHVYQLNSLQSYDGGFGLTPGSESHGEWMWNSSFF